MISRIGLILAMLLAHYECQFNSPSQQNGYTNYLYPNNLWYGGGLNLPKTYQTFSRIDKPALFDTRRSAQFDKKKNADDEDNFAIGNRIVGGEQISIMQASYQVNYGDKCGGAIISDRWVITAGHCKGIGDYVLLGSSRRGHGDMYRIIRRVVHPLFSRAHQFDYDFQLMELERPIQISSTKAPIAIGGLADVMPGNVITVTGWGRVIERGEPSQLLRRVQMPIVPQDYCAAIPLPLYHVTDRMFCAGYVSGQKDACQGDSGGPVVSNGKLVGLVSFGEGCAVPGVPGVYAKLPLAKDWIRSVTGIQF